MAAQLNKGAILKLAATADDNNEKPVCQILKMIKKKGTNGRSRIQLYLSDGLYMYARTLLSFRLNYLYNSLNSELRPIVQLNEVHIQVVDETNSLRNVIIISNMEVLEANGNLIAEKSDNLKILTIDDINSHLEKLDMNVSDQNNEVIKLKKKLENYKQINVSDIKLNSNNWKILVRISYISKIIHVNSHGRSGTRITMHLLGDTEISCTLFSPTEEFLNKLKLNAVYFMANFKIEKRYNEKQLPNHQCQLKMLPNTLVLPYDENDHEIMDIPFNPITIDQLAATKSNFMFDILGIIVDATSQETCYHKHTKLPMQKRDLIIADISKYKISLSIWNELATAETINKGVVILLKHVTLSTFTGNKDLQMNFNQSIMIENPPMNDVQELKSLYKNKNWRKSLRNLQNHPNFMNLDVLTLTCMEVSELTKEDNSNVTTCLVKAKIVKIDYMNAIYKACKTCEKKVVFNNEGKGYCYKCNNLITSGVIRMRIVITIDDDTRKIDFTMFAPSIEQLMRCKIQALQLLEENNTKAYHAKFKELEQSVHTFYLRICYDNYMGKFVKKLWGQIHQ